jgi:hypothetical protein
MLTLQWMGGRAVECTGLEIRQSCKRFVGSNPTPSATPSAPPLSRLAWHHAKGMAIACALRVPSTGLLSRRRIVELYWVPVGFAVVVLLLVLLLARLVGNSKRREIRKKLGLPVNSRLTPEQSSAFQAFENTDMKLKKSFPTLSDTQRQAMARDVLRDKGVLPKRKKSS